LKRLLSLTLAPVLAGMMLVVPSVASADNTCTPPYCPAPKAVTFDATNIHSDSARLNGTVNPNGSDTTYHFELGTQSGVYTIDSPDDTIDGRKTGDQSVKADVKNLTPNTKYFFRIVANNAGGSDVGQEFSFTTPKNNQGPPINNGNGNGNNGNGNEGPGNGNGNGGPGKGYPQPTIGAPSLTTPVVQNATTTIKQLTSTVQTNGGLSLLTSTPLSSTFTAPSAGSLKTDVFVVGVVGQAFSAKRKLALLARGTHTFKAPGTAKVHLKKRSSKQRLVKRGHTVRLMVRTTFTPAGGTAIILRKYVTVHVKR